MARWVLRLLASSVLLDTLRMIGTGSVPTEQMLCSLTPDWRLMASQLVRLKRDREKNEGISSVSIPHWCD